MINSDSFRATSYLVSERKLGFFVEIKADENFNRRNIFKYFEDQNLSPTQISAKKTVFVRALFSHINLAIK